LLVSPAKRLFYISVFLNLKFFPSERWEVPLKIFGDEALTTSLILWE